VLMPATKTVRNRYLRFVTNKLTQRRGGAEKLPLPNLLPFLSWPGL
jgi:hypothetical protein